jgi:hypothetical protein
MYYFVANAWDFKCDKRLWLRTQVPPCDSKHFQLDELEIFDSASYFRNEIWGGICFLLKESADAIPQKRKHAIRYFKNYVCLYK